MADIDSDLFGDHDKTDSHPETGAEPFLSPQEY